MYSYMYVCVLMPLHGARRARPCTHFTHLWPPDRMNKAHLDVKCQNANLRLKSNPAKKFGFFGIIREKRALHQDSSFIV